ncbi:caspase-8-like isoform X1 [Oratosquilla oratoria]|uniref:caspase-8-like isoform X1 n=1 Tax=Oratosquilla oratoria TaxID=337810 RepID=UPI003F758F94
MNPAEEFRVVDNISDEHVPKILFMAVEPDQMARVHDTSLASAIEDQWSRLLTKFHDALERSSIEPLRLELRVRLMALGSLEVRGPSHLSTLESNFSDHSENLSNDEEDVLEFTEIFKMFGYSVPKTIQDKFYRIVQNKRIPIHIEQGTKEKNSFFVFAENKRIVDICDRLTEADVSNVYKYFRTTKETEQDEALKGPLSLFPSTKHLQEVSGLKEAAFLYLVLSMLREKLLNRLYTHCLSSAIVALQSRTSDETDTQRFNFILGELDKYPVESKPAGICIIFCVLENRKGAEHDMKRVQDVFKNTFGYDVFVKKNPNESDIKFIITKMKAPRNKFYDSLVVWFMGHGDKSFLTVKGGEKIHRRRDLIEPFTEIKWFNKKPKLFFIQACAIRRKKEGRRPSSCETTSLLTDTDSLHWLPTGEEWRDRYGDFIDVSFANNQADMLVSYATMWYQPAARGSQGSLYVDTLVDRLREFGTEESLENVLRRVHYIVNTVSLLRPDDDGHAVTWKQAPYFESSLQKQFMFPKCNECISDSHNYSKHAKDHLHRTRDRLAHTKDRSELNDDFPEQTIDRTPKHTTDNADTREN